jgi:hypothetical protein
MIQFMYMYTVPLPAPVPVALPVPVPAPVPVSLPVPCNHPSAGFSSCTCPWTRVVLDELGNPRWTHTNPTIPAILTLPERERNREKKMYPLGGWRLDVKYTL